MMKKVFQNFGKILRDCGKVAPGVLLWFLLFYVGLAVVAVLEPIYLARIIELATELDVSNGKALIGVIVVYGLCLAYSPCANSIAMYFSQKTAATSDRYFGGQMMEFSKKIKLEELENPEILNRFHKANQAFQWVRHFQFVTGGMNCLKSLIACVGTMIVVGGYSPLLVVTGLVGILPAIWSKAYFVKVNARLRRMQGGIRRRCDYLWGLLANKESVKEMRVMGFERYIQDKWQQTNQERVKETLDTTLDVANKQQLGITIVNLFYGLNLGVALVLMVNGSIGIGAFAACISAFAIYHQNLNALIATMGNLADLYHMLEDYYDYYTIPTETDGITKYQPFEDKIVAKDVHFRYNGSDRDALSGLNLEIKKGEHVVIVGENGSGKTTFSKLLTGAYLPSSGQMSYDGQRTADLNRRSLYDHISVVSQDFVRYQFTLRENIGIGNLKCMEDTVAMERLVRNVAGEEFLDKTGGLDVQLGREFGGLELSGGEWQKVAIARGLWKESDIIILDEPTSALDPLVEYDILTKFVDMIQDKTSVIISHRVGICRTADKIIVMQNGRAVECGGHEELLAAGGEYSRIWSEQAKWYC